MLTPICKAWLLCGRPSAAISQIWVAHGTYDPGRLADTSFVIPAGVSVYGGFAGYETIRDQRNPKKYQTILTGAADAEQLDCGADGE